MPIQCRLVARPALSAAIEVMVVTVIYLFAGSVLEGEGGVYFGSGVILVR